MDIQFLLNECFTLFSFSASDQGACLNLYNLLIYIEKYVDNNGEANFYYEDIESQFDMRTIMQEMEEAEVYLLSILSDMESKIE